MARIAPLPIAALILLLQYILYNIVRYVRSTLRPNSYPPGPSPLPVSGNLHQIPRLYSHLTLNRWAKEYGPITGLKFGPLNIVVLNSAPLVYDLLVKRAAGFNERRPPWVAGNHVLPEGRDNYTLYMTQEWSTALRTLTKNTLVGSGLANLVPMQKASGTRLVWSLFQHEKTKADGTTWTKVFEPWSLAGPVALLSGVPIDNFIRDFGKQWIDDYLLSQMLWIEQLDIRNALADLYPAFRFAPSFLTEWKRTAPVARRYLLNAYYGVLEQGRKSLTREGGSFSQFALIPKLLREKGKDMSEKEERDLAVYMGGLFDAAAGSTLMTIQTLIFALAAHPDAQRKAQDEIDALFGDTIPDKVDLSGLRYLHACVCESQRWRPLGAYPLEAFGLPRKTSSDETVLGYRIPRGTLVVINQWGIAHDPDFYDKPEAYIPDRFVNDPVGAKPGISEVGRKALYTFGAGRRECLGKDHFFQNVKLAMAQVLWAFTIEADGLLETSVEKGFTPAPIMMPLPFKVKFVPRRSEDTMLGEKAKADKALSEIFGQEM